MVKVLVVVVVGGVLRLSFEEGKRGLSKLNKWEQGVRGGGLGIL